MIARGLHIVAALVLAAPVQALDLALPTGARLVLDESAPMAIYDMPVGPWDPSAFPQQTAEGHLTRLVWHVPSYGRTTAQLLLPIRDQLAEEGFEINFTCTDQECGGFDFRFALDVAPEPTMHVNLGDFTYLTAEKTSAEEGDQQIALVISRGGGTGFIHLVHISPPGDDPIDVTLSSRAPIDAEVPVITVEPTELAATLEATGRATLDDLTFETGASALSGADYASLRALASFLVDNPGRQVVLVGHTDAEGALDNNIALSRSRAASVRDHLIAQLNVPAGQLRAEGVGYLAPRAPNSTGEGREMNRRVEVVLTDTE